MTVTTYCSNPECEIELTGRCRLKGLLHDSCTFLDTHVRAKVQGDQPVPTQLPWTGRALTPVTLPLISGLKRPHLISIVGLPRSGKTSFLTSLFMCVRRDGPAAFTFAGSLTLGGWSLLSRYADWTPHVPQRFPPRTSGAHREPGFLHMAFRDSRDELIDLALADAPGEWFDAWVLKDPGDPSLAHPAGWLVANATTVLFFVDTPGFYDEFDSNVVLDQTLTLADRVAAGRPQRVLVVYAKADDTPNEPNRNLDTLREHLVRVFPDHQSFNTASVWNGGGGAGVLDLLEEVLEGQAPSITMLEPSHEQGLARWLKDIS